MNRALLSELIGTLFLCLTVLLSGSPLAVGCMMMVMIYAGKGVASCHFNPALSAAAFLRGRIKLEEALRNMGAQGAGAVLAIILGMIWHQKTGESPDLDAKTFFRMLAGEVLGTFLLAFVMLRVTSESRSEMRVFDGAAIGLALYVGLSTFGGAVFNPAASLSAALLGGAHGVMIVTCLIGSTAGAFLAAFVSKLLDETPAAPPLPTSTENLPPSA
jgi:aquaporin Z